MFCARFYYQASGNLVDVAKIMDPWVTQKGFPVISISSDKIQRKDGSLSYRANQKRFFRDFASKQLKDEHAKK